MANRKELIERLKRVSRLTRQYRQLLEDCIAALESPWVSVDERLPELGEHDLNVWCIVAEMTEYGKQNGAEHNVALCAFDGEKWRSPYVTHWQPLPPPPTDATEGK